MANAAQNEVTDEVAKADSFAEDEDLEAQLAYENLKKRREVRRRKRIIVGALVAAIAVGGGAFYFVSQQQEAADAESALDPMSLTTTVTKGTFATSVTANGATEPLSSTVVTPEVDGIIEGLKVEVGQQVKEGDVLFTVKNDKLDTTVREAQDQLSTAERDRDRKNAAIDKAIRGVDEAYSARQAAWDKANESGEWETYDEASLNAAISSAEDTRDSAYADRDDAEATVEKSRVALEEAQAEADKRTVRAPVSGVIISMSAKEGASTNGSSGEGAESRGEPLMQIVDLSKMKVTVQVNEVDISVIEEGQKATATFSALPDVSLDAEVTRIASTSSGSGDPSGGGVVTYAVDLLIPKPDPLLKPGMTATVTIVTESVPDVLLVSSAAVGEDEEGAYVMVVDDAEAGEVRRANVEIVAQNSSDAAIKGDVMNGDVVLLDPTIATGSVDDSAEGDEMVEVDGGVAEMEMASEASSEVESDGKDDFIEGQL